jgi:hypothetical protein
MSQLKLKNVDVSADEFKLALSFVVNDTSILLPLVEDWAQPTDEVTRANQIVVHILSQVSAGLATLALDHSSVEKHVLAANFEAELVRVLSSQTLASYKTAWEACLTGAPPAMPTRPDKSALVGTAAALVERVKDITWKVEFAADAARATAGRVLLATAEGLLSQANNLLVEPGFDLPDDVARQHLAEARQKYIEAGQCTAETVDAKMKEVFGETFEAQKAFLEAGVRKQLAIGTEGLSVANAICASEMFAIVTKIFDEIVAITKDTA